MLEFYSANGTCALAPHIALREASADYQLHMLSFAKKEELSEPFLSLNPKGRVPALVTDKGILTECPAILAYIAQTYPQSSVGMPADAFDFAQIQSFNSYLCSTVHVAHAHRMRGSRWADDPAAIAEMKRKVPETVGACFQLINDEMIAGPWVMGEQYSISDPYLYTLSSWLDGDGVDINTLPNVAAHFNRMQERPAVIAALAEQSESSQ